MIEVPKDFGDALAGAGLDGFFAGCTEAHQREYLQWIAGAKRPQTRCDRIARALKMLANKRAEEEARESARAKGHGGRHPER
jgi:uncharacterized protein YdeI (YjbR/CyaY-like superfamily)